MLVPAGLLVLVVLGAVCVDAAATYLGQRDLSNAAEAAATGAAGAISDGAFYLDGQIRLDPNLAESTAKAVLARERLNGVVLVEPMSVQVSGRYVCVSLVGRVKAIFGAGLPGISGWTTVRARATATSAGDTGSTLPPRPLC